jgi:hypothetical protein
MAGKAFSGRVTGGRRGRPRRAREIAAVAVAGGLVAVAAAACTAVTPRAAAAGHLPSSGTSRPAPPPVTVLRRAADDGSGDIFVAPSGGSYAGPEIMTSTGRVIWFHALPPGEVATDFRAQTYHGKPVLTWWQGGGPAGSGTDYIYSDRYRPVAVVKAGHGYATDFHEFLITPSGTALITADTVATANLTSIGGPADQQVIDGIVQEIDISTGRVLFQ